MESHIKWSKVLLQWLEACGFVDRKCVTLEQTDIHYMFKIFRSSHTLVPQAESETCLYIFLRDHYPEFIPQMGENGLLCPTEYVLVYSIFLHFSYVKYPEAAFHETFIRLPRNSQRCIGLFLKETFCCPALDRETLRQVLSMVIKKSESPDDADNPTYSASSACTDEGSKDLHGLQDDKEQMISQLLYGISQKKYEIAKLKQTLKNLREGKKLSFEKLGLTEDKNTGRLRLEDIEYRIIENTTNSEQSEISTKCENELDRNAHLENNDSNSILENLEHSVSNVSLGKINQKSTIAMQHFENEAEEFVNETNKLRGERDQVKNELRDLENSSQGVLNVAATERSETSATHRMESDEISSLQIAYESQTDILKQAKQKLSAFEKLNDNQSKTIEILQQVLKETINERDRLAGGADGFKSHLRLEKMEEMASKMKLVISERDKIVNKVDRNCAVLQSQIIVANELCAKLQIELNKRDAQLQRIKAEQEQDRSNWQTELSNLKRLLVDQSVEQESYDIALLNVSSVIKGDNNLSAEIGNRFESKTPENEHDTNMGQFKSILNRFLSNVTDLQTKSSSAKSSLQPKLNSCENEPSGFKNNLELLESDEELILEKKKFRETQEAYKKHIDILILKLNDIQLRCSKSDHENQKLHQTLKSNLSQIETLQRELALAKKEQLNTASILSKLENKLISNAEDIKQLNQSLSQSETTNVGLNNEISTLNSHLEKLQQQLDEAMKELQREKQLNRRLREVNVSSAESEKIEEVEKERKASEEKMRELSNLLQTTERNNVCLLQKVGTIKLQLSELKTKHKENLQRVTEQRDDARARVARYELLIEELQTDVDNLRDKNTILNNELSEVRRILQKKHQQQAAENKESDVILETQIEVSEEVWMIRTEQQSFCEGTDALKVEIENLRRRLIEAEAIAESERKIMVQLRIDNRILREKYEESQQRLLDAMQMSEERINELEDDLENMREKMFCSGKLE